MPQLHPDLPHAAFRDLGHDVIDLLADYYADLERRRPSPAASRDVAALFDRPPERAEPVDAILADWREKIVPNSSRQGSPRWFGFVNGSGSQIGALADALASAINPNCGGWRASPAATEIERTHHPLARRADRLSPRLRRGHSSAAGRWPMSRHCDRALARATWDIDADGLQSRGGAGRMTVYMADHETHVSFVRAMDLLGLGRSALRPCRPIPISPSTRPRSSG